MTKKDSLLGTIELMVQQGLTTKEPTIQKRTLELILNIQRILTLNQSKLLTKRILTYNQSKQLIPKRTHLPILAFPTHLYLPPTYFNQQVNITWCHPKT